jgi:RNA polymerase sigma factor (TIGR02999 family)
VTEWLTRWQNGDASALDRLMPIIYSELHRLAAVYLRHERSDHTLQATALVHEAYLQVKKLNQVTWQDRGHFIAFASRAMRRILVQHARGKRAAKRGGPFALRVPEHPDHFVNEQDLDVVALDEALDQLAREHPRQAKVVELRFFGGLTVEETAEVLVAQNADVSVRTIERDWRFARAWLQSAMTGTRP